MEREGAQVEAGSQNHTPGSEDGVYLPSCARLSSLEWFQTEAGVLGLVHLPVSLPAPILPPTSSSLILWCASQTTCFLLPRARKDGELMSGRKQQRASAPLLQLRRFERRTR